jgi:leucyl/phenylalanyl-tRNA--protein transferase
MTDIPWLDSKIVEFPPIDNALREPDGLLAAGGDLSVARLSRAYQLGIFPWFEEGQPILWWSPDPRSVIFPDQFKPGRTLARLLRKNKFEVRRDTAFNEVIDACSEPRSYSQGTWITDEMKEAYKELHYHGIAHSIECYLDSELVGGLYGIGLGKLFFGESMFHRVSDASKVAFAFLNRLMVRNDCPLIDCQIPNDHLVSLGARSITRHEFKRYLEKFARHPDPIVWSRLPTLLSPW